MESVLCTKTMSSMAWGRKSYFYASKVDMSFSSKPWLHHAKLLHQYPAYWQAWGTLGSGVSHLLIHGDFLITIGLAKVACLSLDLWLSTLLVQQSQFTCRLVELIRGSNLVKGGAMHFVRGDEGSNLKLIGNRWNSLQIICAKFG